MTEIDLQNLLKKYREGACTPEEFILLENWYFQWQVKHERFTDEDLMSVKEEVWRDLAKAIRPAKQVRLWPKIGIAAAVAVVVFGAGLFFFNRQNAGIQAISYASDIAPGKNGALLTLANGQQIQISDTLTGNIANQAGVKICKTANGQIVYEMMNGESGNPGYNTLSTTRGQQTQLLLPDGTLVFLNASSALKYPVSFAKLKKRQVTLSGEGYFEIAKDKDHPFVVQTDQQELEVLGTHFNVSAYSDVKAVKTTLFEGSVKLLAAGKQVFLKPGQQVQLAGNSFYLNPYADLEEVLAWKNGYFKFNENLETIMAKVARWYDVEIVYDKKPDPDLLFEGKISRSRNISALLKIMESTGNVHFKIKGRRILVME